MRGPSADTGRPTQRAAIDKLLDLADGTCAYKAWEDEEFFPFRHFDIAMTLRQPGAQSATLVRIPTRALSRWRLFALHLGYIHEGTLAQFDLPTLSGSPRRRSGRVASCRYLQRQLHELEIHFDEELDPSEHCLSAAPCRVMLVTPDPLLLALLEEQLRTLHVDVQSLPDGESALTFCLGQHYDLIILDVDIVDYSYIEVVTILRNKGYAGPIAAFSHDQTHRQQYIQLGFNDWLTKPHNEDELAKLVNKYRRVPLHSSKQGDPRLKQLIQRFVAELSGKVEEIERCLADGDSMSLAALARNLGQTGSAYGFQPISTAAYTLLDRLDHGAAPWEAQRATEELVRICRLTSAPR